MFNKINTKYLIVAFVVLLIVFLLVKRSDNKKGARTFDPVLTQIEFENVTNISIQPKMGGAIISLFKENDQWKVRQSDKTYHASESSVENVINILNESRKDRLAAVSDSKWKQYEVTDSLGTRVTINGNKEVLADIIIGRFSYRQATQNPNMQNPQMQQQPRGVATSYVRTADEKEVFAINGFLSMNFNQGMQGFRDRTVLKGNKSQWSKITVTQPGDSSFVLEKQAGKWLLNNASADSISVVNFLTGISNLTAYDFSDETAISNATHKLVIEGEDLDKPITITALPYDEQYLIYSSQNEGTIFSSKPDGVFQKLFASRPKKAN